MRQEPLMWLVVSLLSLVRYTAGRSAGAPDAACSDLIPQHGGASAQTSPSPYTVTFSPATFTAGGSAINGKDLLYMVLFGSDLSVRLSCLSVFESDLIVCVCVCVCACMCM